MSVSSLRMLLCSCLVALSLAGCATKPPVTLPEDEGQDIYRTGKIRQLFVVVPDEKEGLLPPGMTEDDVAAASGDRIVTADGAPATAADAAAGERDRVVTAGAGAAVSASEQEQDRLVVAGAAAAAAAGTQSADPGQSQDRVVAADGRQVKGAAGKSGDRLVSAEAAAATAATAAAATAATREPSPQLLAAEAWQKLYARIVQRQEKSSLLVKEFAKIHQELTKLHSKTDFGSKRRYYPLLGYGSKGAKKGMEPYQAKGYRFFSVPVDKKAHPAHDLAILDQDRDGRDDQGGGPVPVLAYSGGVVVAVRNDWSPERPGAEGNYVWVLDPRDSRYYCYAQLDEATVAVGDIVRAGEELGRAGRSGDRASLGKSATHLHLMTLRYRDGKIAPYNIWQGLVEARRGRYDAQAERVEKEKASKPAAQKAAQPAPKAGSQPAPTKRG